MSVRAAGFLLLGTFLVLAAGVHFGLWRQLDQEVTPSLVRGASCRVLDVGSAVSPWFSAEVSLGLAIALAVTLGWSRRRWQVVLILAGLLGTLSVELLTKNSVEQLAPSQAFHLARIDCWGEEGFAPYKLETVETPYSFPSGWTTRLGYFAALAVLAAGRVRHGRWPAIALVALVTSLASGTRMLIGWHWPTDVVGGLLLGAGTACLTWWAMGDGPWVFRERGRMPHAVAAAHSEALDRGRGKRSGPSWP